MVLCADGFNQPEMFPHVLGRRVKACGSRFKNMALPTGVNSHGGMTARLLSIRNPDIVQVKVVSV